MRRRAARALGSWGGRLAAAAALVVALAVGLRLLIGEGALHFSDVAHITQALERPSPTTVAPPRAEEDLAAAPPPSQRVAELAPADPALMEAGTFGPLPQIGPDGRRPLIAYARPVDLDDEERPQIAIVVLGLGLEVEVTEAALGLPGAISLEVSPYALNLAALVPRARADGHEVLLNLPMEPEDYPESDPGPHTLLADISTTENLERLSWVLAQGAGYVGVVASGGRFATSEQARPVLDALAARGLGLIEVGNARMEAAAREVGLPYAAAGDPIDEEPLAVAIDYALAELETAALESGSALGVAQAYPVTIERLQSWASTLESKGLALVPASALLIESSGLATGMRGEGGEGRASHG